MSTVWTKQVVLLALFSTEIYGTEAFYLPEIGKNMWKEPKEKQKTDDNKESDRSESAW